MLSWLQSVLIFPGQYSQGKAPFPLDADSGVELLTLETRGTERVAAVFGGAMTSDGRPHPEANRCPTVLYFYGNGSNLNLAQEELRAFRRLGCNVLIPEYLGYGLSGGRASEDGCYATAEAAVSYLLRHPNIDPSRIVASGWSLGGAVAIDLASRQPLAGLIVFSTFTRMIELARLHYPFLPASRYLRHHFESEAKIAQIRCPSLIIHGEKDPLIPVAMADRLARAAGGPVTRLDIPEARHDNVFEIGQRQIYQAVAEFLDLHIRPSRPSCNHDTKLAIQERWGDDVQRDGNGVPPSGGHRVD